MPRQSLHGAHRTGTPASSYNLDFANSTNEMNPAAFLAVGPRAALIGVAIALPAVRHGWALSARGFRTIAPPQA